jgi:hypothetical protein
MRLQQFLDESKRNKIYFAHPRAYYDKPEEKKAIAMMTKEWSDYLIVNPNVDWIQGRVTELGFDIFFKVINTVEFICVMPFPDGKVGNGSWRECQYANKQGKDIYVVNPWKGTIIKTPFNKIKGITPEETYDRIPKKEQHKWLVYEGVANNVEAKLKGNDYIVTKADGKAQRAHSLFKAGQKIPKDMFLHMLDRYNLLSNVD